MIPTVTPIYAGLLAVLFFWLSFRVSMMRLKGPAVDEKTLHTAVRTQGNAAEYIPLGLIMLLILELQDASPVILHVLGLMLLLGRLGHFASFGRTGSVSALRKYSMVITYTMLLASGLMLLYFSFF